jgi:hypothetical protein
LHGPLPEKWAGVTDAPHLWRKAPFIILLAGLLVFGCFPGLLVEKIRPSAEQIVEMVHSGGGNPPGGVLVTQALRNR